MAELWAATMRHGIPYHRISGKRAGKVRDVVVLELACGRHTVEGRGEHPTEAEIAKHAMVPCVRCFPDRGAVDWEFLAVLLIIMAPLIAALIAFIVRPELAGCG